MTSAIVSGCGFLLLVYSIFGYFDDRENFNDEDTDILASIMKYGLAIEIVLLLMQVLYFVNSSNRAQFQYIFIF